MFKPLADCSIHIIGLGLMGGSLAMALRGQVARLPAADVATGVLDAALQNGVIDAQGSADAADIVILAVPADRIIDLIPTLHLSPGTLVMDLGSTKTHICEQLDRLPDGVYAVGGHPMCGLAENGYRNATAAIYQRARFVLCETAHTVEESRLLAEALVVAAGARYIWMDRHQHDHITALTSHLPHLLSFALMRLAMNAAAEDPMVYQLAAGGFDGATRLARTDATMISGMFQTNAEMLREVTAQFRAVLDQIDGWIDDPHMLYEHLNEVVTARRTLTSAYGERMLK